MSLQDIRQHPNVPASWPSAGIVDARAFTVGRSDIIHDLTHAAETRVRGACGVTAWTNTDTRAAAWASGYVGTECPTCKARR